MIAAMKDIYESELFKKYDTLSEELRNVEAGDEKVIRLQTFVRDIEREIVAIPTTRRRDMTPEQYDMLEALLLLRCSALNDLFEYHCSDAEVERFTAVNEMLYGMTKSMYERTRMLGDCIKSMPLHPKDDDVEIEARLRFWNDCAPSVLQLEDDSFYGSDFTKMIELLSLLYEDHICLEDIHHLTTNTCIEDGVLKIDNDFKDDLDDGVSWAEAWLRHPKLDHLVICHAVHDICTHKNFSIPDLLRMNTFEVSVEMRVQQIQDQDGARCFWIHEYTPEQVKEKLMAEAQHRPSGMSVGEFIHHRCKVYYEDLVEKVPADLDCRGNDDMVIPFMDALLALE